MLRVSLLALVGIGCGQQTDAPAGPDAARPRAEASADTPSRTPPGVRLPDVADANAPVDANRPVMAMVAGRPIYMDRLHEILVEIKGSQIASHLILNELVRQEARRRGVDITGQDVLAEGDAVCRRLFGEDLTRRQLEESLEAYLADPSRSREEWELMVYREALLGRMVRSDIEIPEEMLRDEFGRRYGRKVVVRHIEVASRADAKEVLDRLEEGNDFADVAAKYSTNPSGRNGGLLPAFGADEARVPPAFRKVALSLDRVGEVSNPVKVQTRYHILKLERVIEPRDVRFEDVRDEVEEVLKARLSASRKEALLGELLRAARDEGRIRIVHPVLKEEWDRHERARREAGAP
jgi:foldase protein PrsA